MDVAGVEGRVVTNGNNLGKSAIDMLNVPTLEERRVCLWKWNSGPGPWKHHNTVGNGLQMVVPVDEPLRTGVWRERRPANVKNCHFVLLCE